jgi:hypothetical protein
MSLPGKPAVPPPRVSWTAGLLVAIGSVAITLLLVEGALRATGFEYHLMPAVQFGGLILRLFSQPTLMIPIFFG